MGGVLNESRVFGPPNVLQDIEIALSPPRLRRYVGFATGDVQKGIRLYRWNCWLSQSLIWPLHMVEIATRNSVSSALASKYGARWFFEPRFRSVLDARLRDRLDEAYDRQRIQRRTSTPQIDQIIADLTLGVWTALLARRYDVPFGWSTRIRNAFPSLPAGKNRSDISARLDDLRDLRNRIAHHEPILQLNLQDKYQKMMDLLIWKSPNLHWVVAQTCAFSKVLGQRPPI